MTLTQEQIWENRFKKLEDKFNLWRKKYVLLNNRIGTVQDQAIQYQRRAVGQRAKAFAGARKAIKDLNKMIETVKELQGVSKSLGRVRGDEKRYVRLSISDLNRLNYFLERDFRTKKQKESNDIISAYGHTIKI